MRWPELFVWDLGRLVMTWPTGSHKHEWDLLHLLFWKFSMLLVGPEQFASSMRPSRTPGIVYNRD